MDEAGPCGKCGKMTASYWKTIFGERICWCAEHSLPPNEEKVAYLTSRVNKTYGAITETPEDLPRVTGNALRDQILEGLFN